MLHCYKIGNVKSLHYRIHLERIRAEKEKLQQQTKAAKKSKGKTTKRRSKKAPQQTEEAIQLELPGMEE